MAWFRDPTEVPKVPKRPVGRYKYQYSRLRSGMTGKRFKVDYGPREGMWAVKRTWEGRPVEGMSPWSRYPQTRLLSSAWRPEANQFPWTTRRGITSDVQRQAAFQLGIGGTRPIRPMRKPAGSYFDPQAGFGAEQPRGYAPGAAFSSMQKRIKKTGPRWGVKYKGFPWNRRQ